MKENNKRIHKFFFMIVLAFFLSFFSFFIYSFVTGNISLGEDVEKWDGLTVAASFESGNGTLDNPFVIQNAEQFMYFKELIEGDSYTAYYDKYYVLGNNIDFGEHEITPIGVMVEEEKRIFEGTLDGKGYSLQNFQIKKPSVFQDTSYYSLFSEVVNAHIFQIGFSNYTIKPDLDDTNSIILSGLVGNASSQSLEDEVENDESFTELHDLFFHNFVIDNTEMLLDNNSVNILGFVSKDVIIRNVYLNGEILKKDQNVHIVDGEFDHNISSILMNVSYEGELDSSFIDQYSYFQNDIFILNQEETDISNLLSLWNESIDPDYFWVYENGNLFIKTYKPVDETVPQSSTEFSFSIQSSSPIAEHGSGFADNVYYVNDLQSDLNYYNGLNYTTTADGKVPTGASRNFYSDSNLVKVFIAYHGKSIEEGSTKVGYVSPSELYSDIIYYKYFVAENGYIKIPLIDNPYAVRPYGFAFNGWVTDYEGAVLSYDSVTYTRYVTIPVSEGPISISMYASWTEQTLVNASVSNENLNTTNLKDIGMYPVTSISVDTEGLPTLYSYLSIQSGNSRDGVPYPDGAVDEYGDSLDGERCVRYSRNNPRTCHYYLEADVNGIDPDSTYYYLSEGTMTVYTFTGFTVTSFLDYGTSLAGFYKKVPIPRARSYAGYYDSQGVYQEDGVCNDATCYYYELLNYAPENFYSESTPDDTYFYLATRDTNIAFVNSNIYGFQNNKPVTVTGVNVSDSNGTITNNSTTYGIQIYSSSDYYYDYTNYTIRAGADLRIEYVKINSDYSSGGDSGPSSGSYTNYIYGNFYNVKIGRGITNRSSDYFTANGIVGGYSGGIASSGSPKKYRLIVESGYYNTISAVTPSGAGSSYFVNVESIIGSDLDRVRSQHENLKINYNFASSYGGSIYSDNYTSYLKKFSTTYIKSGTIGMMSDEPASGIYVGGLNGGTINAPSSLIVEGGKILYINGGPLISSDLASYNAIYINVKGGEVTNVFGGAARSLSHGNRIINVTDGTVLNAVFGGSNGFEGNDSSDNNRGTINGDTFVYVGGKAIIGTGTTARFGEEIGSVFGAGNGNSGSTQVGSVNNSNVVIGPTADIRGNVYGGGNFGAVAGNLVGNVTPSGSTDIEINGGVFEDGTTDNNIRYYGSDPNNYIQFNGELYRIIGLFNNVSTSDGDKSLVRIIKNSYSSSSTQWIDSNNRIRRTGNNYIYPNYFVRNDSGATKSYMYNYLNSTFYNNINSTYRNYIQPVNWSLGAINSADNNASEFYAGERSNTAGSTYSTTSYNFNVGLFYPSDYGFASGSGDCLTTDLSEYSYYCSNWMSDTVYYSAWTMTPSSTNASNYVYYNFYMYYGDIARNTVRSNSGYRSYAVYPSFYLKDTVTISGGTGTEDDPYIIGSSEKTINDLVYKLMHPDPVVDPDDPDPGSSEDGGYEDPGDYQARTYVRLIGGTVNGSVYGAANNNGSGNNNDNKITTTLVKIDLDGGTVKKSIYGGSNTKGTVYGDTLINLINGKVEESVYGGGKGGYSSDTSPGTYVSRNVDVNVGNDHTNSLTITKNVYGGSAFGSVNGTSQEEATNDNYVRVNVSAGTVTGSVFGGGQGDADYTPNEFGNVYVHVNGGTVTSVFGGNDSKGSPSGSNIVYLNGGTIGNAFGGGNETGQTNTDIRLQGSTITDSLYGGSNNSGNITTSHVTVTSGTVTNVFGGNNKGGETTTANVSVTGGTFHGSIYGGGESTSTGKSIVNVNGLTATSCSVYGGGQNAGMNESTDVTITSSNISKVFGGSNVNGTVPISNVHVDSSTVTSVYGGNNSGGNTVTTNVDVSSSTITNVYGGGDNAPSTTSNVEIVSGTITNVYGGGNNAGLTTSNVTVTSGSITSLFGGSNQKGDVATSNVSINGGNITSTFGGNNLGGVTTNTNIVSTAGVCGTVYGGGNKAKVVTSTLNLTNLTASRIYGGGNLAEISGDVSLSVINSTVNDSLFGGGNAAGVKGDISLIVKNSNVTNNVYGGGNEGIVEKNTDVTLTNSHISGNAFAGGNGATAIVYGNSTITVEGTTEVGTDSSHAPDAGCVFGSGNAASTGRSTSPSVATVNIVGGNIHGNVYGGPKMAVVYGVTETNIGTSAVSRSGLLEDDIHIHGTVFGGGESNASGSENYDYTFISVTNGITVNINGFGYIPNNHKFIINGSIFGSGNASSSNGESNINIKNLGSKSQPNQAISVQRATNLVIDSSVIELSGTTDRTNELSDFKYSFNQIDKMVIKNGTTLLLHHNANLLRELYSGVDENGTLVPAVVDIDDESKTVTANVDNRIYMLPGENLHVAVNQSATAYGRVTGMTFFGMYTNENNVYRFGLYGDDYTYGDSANAGLEIVGGSYVLGLRYDNYDITKNGFYTNYLNEDTYSDILTAYIDPDEIGETGYRWTVGFEAINYSVELFVSKFSSLGADSLSLIDFAEGNSTFEVMGFDASNLAPSINLVDPLQVPRLGRTAAEANNTIGLAMKVETQEWTGSGTTKFLGTDGGSVSGDRFYRTDSRKLAPTLMFYSYHTKNFDRPNDDDMGSGIITIQVTIPKNAIEYDIKFLTITVQLTAKSYGNEAAYDASITYDKKYEMPAFTDVHITNQSQFTMYYSLTQNYDTVTAAYGERNDYYHQLEFKQPLPVGTMITMLDYGANPNRPDYYYFEVTDEIYDASLAEISVKNSASYPLRNFIKMDSTSEDNTYDDRVANLLYYKNDYHLVDEEFIFIVDLKGTTTVGDHLKNEASFSLCNSEGVSLVSLVSARASLMNYNTYESSNVVLSQVFDTPNSYLYYGIEDTFDYSTKILYNETDNRQSVIDTNYEYSNMGLNIVFLDKNGDTVSSSLLVGTTFRIDNQEYYADGDGTIRVKLADKVSNIDRRAGIMVGNSLPPDVYTIRYTLFASPDGLHNSTYENSVTYDLPVTVIDSNNSITVTTEDYTKLVNGDTGLNQNDTKLNSYTLKYASQLSNPNIRIEVMKRDITTSDSVVYSPVEFKTLFQSPLAYASTYEVYLNMDEDTERTFSLLLADELTSGTYRVVFKLYDNYQLIDEDYQYVIVTKETE